MMKQALAAATLGVTLLASAPAVAQEYTPVLREVFRVVGNPENMRVGGWQGDNPTDAGAALFGYGMMVGSVDAIYRQCTQPDDSLDQNSAWHLKLRDDVLVEAQRQANDPVNAALNYGALAQLAWTNVSYSRFDRGGGAGGYDKCFMTAWDLINEREQDWGKKEDVR